MPLCPINFRYTPAYSPGCYNVLFPGAAGRPVSRAFSIKSGGLVVAALRAFMRGFSYLYHLILALFLLGLCLVALTTRQQLQLRMLPWQGTDLTYWLLGGSLLGLVSVMLALARKFRVLFFLWSLIVFAVILRGFFFSPYHFAGKPAFYRALLLSCGALLAVFGAWSQMRRRRPVR